MTDVRYPNTHVRLVGEDGNAFAILARVDSALRRGGCTPEEIDEYVAEATAGDYDNLLAVTMRWVNTDDDTCPTCDGTGRVKI